MVIGEKKVFENKVINYIKFKVLPHPDDVKLKRYSFVDNNTKIYITFYFSEDNHISDGWFIGQDIQIKYSDIIQFDRINKIKDILC